MIRKVFLTTNHTKKYKPLTLLFLSFLLPVVIPAKAGIHCAIVNCENDRLFVLIRSGNLIIEIFVSFVYFVVKK